MSVFTEEAWKVMCFALPQMAILYATVIVTSGTLTFVGTYDPEPTHLAGAVLGSMYYQVTGLSVGCGLSIQLGAFCAQNCGRGAAHENGIFFWKCVKTLSGAFAFAVFAAVGASWLLGKLGQPADVIMPATLFNSVQVLSLIPNWGASVLNATLASQRRLLPGVVATTVGNLVNLCLAWWLLAVEDVGFLGVAWGNVAGQWVSFALMLLYVVLAGCQTTVWHLPSPDKTTLKISLSFYIREALPSAFSLWAEWWAACILGVLAGLLPRAEASVAANGILFSCLSVFYMTFVGVQMATQQRMGELVGSRDVARIPTSIASAATVALSLAVGVSVMLQVYGGDMMRLYTHDPSIVDEAMQALPGMVLSIAPYAAMMCFLGAMRPAGLQRWGTGALIVSFYIIGIPFAAYAGLVLQWGLLGIWSGNVLALSIAALSMFAKIYTVEWSGVVEKAMAYQQQEKVSSEIATQEHPPLLEPLLRDAKIEA